MFGRGRVGWGGVAWRFAALFAPVVVVVVGGTWLYRSQVTAGEVRVLRERERTAVIQARDGVEQTFRWIVADALVAAGHRAVPEALSGPDPAGARRRLATEYLLESRQRGVYDQIRLLDAGGREVVRVDHNGGAPAVTPEDELQDKGGRYYFTDAFALEPGQLYVSPFDLNVENGAIERPFKPMIRLATPVAGTRGRKAGVVVLNYMGRQLLDDLDRLSRSSSGTVFLVDQSGYFLRGPDPGWEWGFMLEDRGDRRFSTFDPDAWAAIRNGGGQVRTDRGLYTFRDVLPLRRGEVSSTGASAPRGPSAGRVGPDAYRWTVVSFVPADRLVAGGRPELRRSLWVAGAVLGAGALAAWALAVSLAVRRGAELALRESEARYARAQRAANIGSWEWDLASGRMRWTETVPAMFGLPPGRLSGDYSGFLEAVHPDDRVRVAEAVDASVRGRSDLSVEFRVVPPDGTPRWVYCTGDVVRDVDDRAVRLAGIVQDVTRRKELEARALLARKMESLGVMAGGVAHHFNNVLAGILGHAELALDHMAPGSRPWRHVDAIRAGVERAAEVSSRMRDFAAGIQVTDRPCPLNPPVAAEVGAVEVPAEVALELDLAPVTPRVRGEPSLLRQVVRDLVDNAVEAVAGNGGRVTVSTGSMECDGLGLATAVPSDAEPPAGRCALILVEDTGPGMDEHTRSSMFDPFFTTRFAGRGLGLARALGIVRAHNGVLLVESAPGRGTRVRVVLPAIS